MRTEKEIRDKIAKLNDEYRHVLTGNLATTDINVPRALMQVHAEAILRTLHWVLRKEFKSKLKGTNT